MVSDCCRSLVPTQVAIFLHRHGWDCFVQLCSAYPAGSSDLAARLSSPSEPIELWSKKGVVNPDNGILWNEAAVTELTLQAIAIEIQKDL